MSDYRTDFAGSVSRGEGKRFRGEAFTRELQALAEKHGVHARPVAMVHNKDQVRVNIQFEY